MIKRKDAISRTEKTLRLMRCLEEIIDSFSASKPFPKAACFQRSKVYYKLASSSPSSSHLLSVNSNSNPQLSAATSALTLHHHHHQHHQQDSNIYLFDSPIDNNESYFNILNSFEYISSDHVIDKNVIDYFVTNSCIRINQLGKWVLITKIKVGFFLFAISIDNFSIFLTIVCLTKRRK
jgi:hypothetical protein